MVGTRYSPTIGGAMRFALVADGFASIRTERRLLLGPFCCGLEMQPQHHTYLSSKSKLYRSSLGIL